MKLIWLIKDGNVGLKVRSSVNFLIFLFLIVVVERILLKVNKLLI